MTTDLANREQDLILALVDGSVPREQQASVEMQINRLPGGREALERQRVVAAALADAPRAPDGLRAAIAREQERAAAPRKRRRVWTLTFAGTACAFVLALVLVLSAGGGPSVAQAAALGALPATEPTPGPAAGDPAQLDKRFEGVTFPDWRGEFGWIANGARTDTIDGRRAQTVFYLHEGHRLGYTVVSGDPLTPPEGARHLTVDGLAIAVYTEDGRDVAMFERNGRTCVVSGNVLALSTLVELSAWNGVRSNDLPGGAGHHH